MQNKILRQIEKQFENNTDFVITKITQAMICKEITSFVHQYLCKFRLFLILFSFFKKEHCSTAADPVIIFRPDIFVNCQRKYLLCRMLSRLYSLVYQIQFHKKSVIIQNHILQTIVQKVWCHKTDKIFFTWFFKIVQFLFQFINTACWL